MTTKKDIVNSSLSDRVSWTGQSQARVRKYGRVIAVAKRFSIFFGKTFPNAFPLVFVLGHPKSGTTWMCQLLADYFRLPFPQHSIMPIGCSAVVHSFEAPSKKYRKGVYMIRDGRDTVVSTYFHVRGRLLAGGKERHNRTLFAGLDPNAEPSANIATFLRRLHANPTGGLSKLPSWGQHVNAYFEKGHENLQIVKYEDLLDDGCRAFGEVVSKMAGCEADVERVADTVRRYSFKNQTGRKQGQENRGSYLRKGEAGDWKNHFSKEAAEVFHQYYGTALIRAGYVADANWINQVQ